MPYSPLKECPMKGCQPPHGDKQEKLHGRHSAVEATGLPVQCRRKAGRAHEGGGSTNTD
eukprot:CAMPEP_0177155758 /NCGR_PEP_ID=MMETSP0367-20130122/2345_1 /TAXON_ID=447022 ORGANISM="Scrippsiella hangoei-like, Strain SHHI-4" /NCGR_SAMPLE_ID=MMETSP0367 /ASSEMBLY_ACC=CAM_ASM_000362 /LENGTH=58 /DNA_ID=CAMNT_0018601129 /DNA_START=8 /DNA_END=184 /DNA_ORIENTATION=+